MAQNIEVEASLTDDGISASEIRNALDTVGDVSNKSPITPGVNEAAVIGHDDRVVVRVQGHDGEWSESSERALLRAIEGVDGVGSASVTSGGHETAESASEGSDDPEAAADEETSDAGDAAGVETIDGVGTDRAETMKEAGIETVDDVIDVGADGLVEAGISEGVAENIVDSV